jgi:hypothetical protein
MNSNSPTQKHCFVSEAVLKGRLIMNNGALASIPSSECNDFLLAIISEAPNGTQLTVLSALAQANVDPWEEAARLSAMPKVTAEKALVSMFDRIPGRDWSPSEEATIAARLVELLPPRGRRMESPTTTRAGLSVPLLLVWLTWVSIAIAMSIMSVPRHPTATVDSGVPPSSGVTATSNSVSAPAR